MLALFLKLFYFTYFTIMYHILGTEFDALMTLRHRSVVNTTFSKDDAILTKKSPSVERLCLEISVSTLLQYRLSLGEDFLKITIASSPQHSGMTQCFR